ncbi:MAG TPA: hypothetical protein VJV79_03820 [Polyangiaceae bacterium]|nr:hypothetical protein [Polyangiaceae bacterium]
MIALPLLRPHDVFTPAFPPIELSNAYASRKAPEEDFQQALDRCQVPVVFGAFGVGKTSMARHVIRTRLGLVEQERLQILKEGAPDDGTPALNYVSFADPGMKAFLRLRATAERDGVL